MGTNTVIHTFYSIFDVIYSLEIFKKPHNSPPLTSQRTANIDSSSSNCAVEFQFPFKKGFLFKFFPPGRGWKNGLALHGIFPHLGFHWSLDWAGFMIVWALNQPPNWSRSTEFLLHSGLNWGEPKALIYINRRKGRTGKATSSCRVAGGRWRTLWLLHTATPLVKFCL